jgi:hypothetical protein
MRVNVRCTDGVEFVAEPVYNWNRTLIYAVPSAYLIIPWEDVEKSWVTYEDFQEAQRKAKEDKLELAMEEFRKNNAPKHNADGHTWTEI